MTDVPVPQPGDWVGRRGDRSSQKGAAGERRFGRALNEAALLRGGCWVSHGLVLPSKQADIDHIVIGPAGVTVIDAKTWEGKVWIGRLGIGRGRRAFPQEIDGMSRQINRVHSTLAKAGRDDVPVSGVLCMVNDNPGVPANGFADIRGVKIGHRRATIEHALRDGPVDGTSVDEIHQIVSTDFRIHGGSQPPSERAPSHDLAPPRPRSGRLSSPDPPRRRRLRVRFGRWQLRLALGLLGCIALATAASLLAHVIPASLNKLAAPYRTFSRGDLQRLRPELRRVAKARAHGAARGPRIRETPHSFVVTFRRGRHCRVIATVSRAAPIFGGGRYTITAHGCGRRR